MRTDRETVELFHLSFLRLLSSGKDKARFIVKGGCNLRFFFGSLRFSEDLDLDVEGVPQHAVKDHVDAILGSRVLKETLASAGIAIGRLSAPKQTPTTQRWKAELIAVGREVPLHTKIELSRRPGEEESRLESVDPNVTQRYQLMPVLACHYLLPSAIRQKLGALVGRREVQARDVFDLNLLVAKAGGHLRGYADLKAVVASAIERVWALSFADYRGQVVAYLDPGLAAPLSSQAAWEAMQLQLVSALEEIGAGR